MKRPRWKFRARVVGQGKRAWLQIWDEREELMEGGTPVVSFAWRKAYAVLSCVKEIEEFVEQFAPMFTRRRLPSLRDARAQLDAERRLREQREGDS